MMKKNGLKEIQVRLMILTAVFLLLMPVSAFAYLDPTTGSMVISAIVGLFASLVLAIKTYWYRIKSFFTRKPAASDPDDGST
jgi:hypothetical protein